MVEDGAAVENGAAVSESREVDGSENLAVDTRMGWRKATEEWLDGVRRRKLRLFRFRNTITWKTKLFTFFSNLIKTYYRGSKENRCHRIV